LGIAKAMNGVDQRSLLLVQLDQSQRRLMLNRSAKKKNQLQQWRTEER
jgi:hypothetical protein